MFNLVYVHATRQTGRMVSVMDTLRIRSTKSTNIGQRWSRWERYMFREADLYLSISSLPWYSSLSYCLSVSLSLFLCLCVCVCLHVSKCV